MSVVMLSRLQFALTIMFHYIFPPLAIGMGAVLVVLEGMYLKTKDPLYESAAKFWTKLFALNFAIGVASGIVMEFQFGTNWAIYSKFVGDVFGSALAAEGIFAFFLESGFLAVLVFGWNKVGPKMHFFSTVMVALGSIFSSIWIIVANSWQQTPAGHHVVPMLRDGKPWIVEGVQAMRAEILDFWAVVFNPSTVERLVHVWIGALIMGAFFIMSISAYYILRGRHLEFAKRSFRGALLLGTLASVAALVSGHSQARNVYRNQPAKLAAFEGHFKTGRGDLQLFGIPDETTQTVKAGLALPGGLGFLLHHDSSKEVVGLDKFRPEDRPPVLLPFIGWRLMVGIGSFFVLLTLLACILLRKGALWNLRPLLWVFVLAVIPAVVANQAGWMAAEVGRQPWIVHPPVKWDASGGLAAGADGFHVYDETQGLRTADAASKAVSREQVIGSIAMFGAIYVLLSLVWVFVLDRKIRQGPEPAGPQRGPEKPEGFLEVAAERAGRAESMTEAKEDAP
jgi:cytochrome d ubiquinol oxidase subunit I